ncbi:MAG: glycosyltransferase [Flavobacteriales bacterium]|nr:glycosyltransferase [Flavobacteriales bacterium]
MKLSVIIVNYNVKHFLEQCLNSVRIAMKNIHGEVYVVDNASVDGSMQMVKTKFPEVKRIENLKNVGFSMANNQAMKVATGEYVLLLNPDTLVEEDTFKKVVSFMDEHPDAGGLGVKMIDGKGNFLPESKRGLPAPSVAFYKIFGLSSLFSRSKKFNQYHLGHLDNDKTHEIDILSGAFMLMRKEALDKVGLLDEAFFMYGEDIDLSYRLQLGGFKNYYFPETKIIHYKGESTKKGSLNYVFVFYNAMVIFAKKHFSKSNARLFSFFINIAIYLRAGIAIAMRTLRKVALPLLDIALLSAGLLLLKDRYEAFSGISIPKELVLWAFPVIALVWVLGTYLSSGYDKWPKPINLIKGVLIGSLMILIAYSILPEHLRFSRAIIFISPLLALIYFFLSRWVFGLVFPSLKFEKQSDQRFLIIGKEEETNRIVELLNQTQFGSSYIRTQDPSEFEKDIDQTVYNLSEILSVDDIDEVVFCAKDVSSQEIINIMARLEDKKIEFKIAPSESLFIIGSNSIKDPGELFILDLDTLSSPANRRNKRILDVLLSMLFLTFYLVLFLFIENKVGFLKNIFLVLLGKRTWVGFCADNDQRLKLPSLKRGVISPINTLKSPETSEATRQKLNIVYARNYKISTDLSIIQKGFSKLGSQLAR